MCPDSQIQCRGTRLNHSRCLSSFNIPPHLGSLSSAGITRRPRSYEPLRHPANPACPHGVPVGACTPLTEFPVLPRLPSSMHAGATTPADAARCTCRFSSRTTDGLPLIQGGSASALPVSRPAQRSLHVPACMVAELLNATLLSGVLQSMSLPPRTAPAATSRKRQLLGGIRTHQENAPFHGALGS